MKVKHSIFLKNMIVPFPWWIIILIIYTLPFFLDDASGETEYVWLVYVIPAIILSYYWGIWGGVITAVVSSLTQIIWELSLFHLISSEYNNDNLFVVLTTTVLSFAIAIGVGLLANKLKKVQNTIEEQNRELQNKNKLLDDLSHIDELTGLWNRRGLVKLAEYWIKSNKDQQHFGVLFIDLDHFKPVNDTYGHQAGDQLLKEVAKRLKGCVPNHAVISRIGGDEFIILLPRANEAFSIHVAQLIRDDLSKLFLIDEKEIYVTPSIGISLSAAHGKDVESLLQKADIAMYTVKRKGRNGYSIFKPYMKELSENRLQRVIQLRKALENEEFCLYYQPQLDTSTGKTTSFEALIRWNLNGDIISPMEFIPLAEETGLILPIGQWVLETACKQMKRWLDAGIPTLPVSINVSSYQFQQPDFVQSVQKVLTETKIKANLLKLELTESVILGKEEVTISKLMKLKQLGVSLSIDDFGSGYSSLTYLKNFPIDEIKMDKSFIEEIPSNLRDRSLVQSIINLGHSLDCVVTAEGVETQEQLAFLKEAGCNKVQGYLTGIPMQGEAAVKILLESENVQACQMSKLTNILKMKSLESNPHVY